MAFAKGSISDILLRDRHFPSHAEGATCYLKTGRGLSALVFVEVDTALNPAHGFFLETAGNDVARAQIFLHIELEDLIEDIVGRERILIDLAGF